MNLTNDAAPPVLLLGAGKPTKPEARPSLTERKTADPSPSSSKSGGYPIPSFFQRRIKGKDYDPL